MTVIVGELCAGNGQLSTVDISAATKTIGGSGPLIVIDTTSLKRRFRILHQGNAAAVTRGIGANGTVINIQGILCAAVSFRCQIDSAAATLVAGIITMGSIIGHRTCRS